MSDQLCRLGRQSRAARSLIRWASFVVGSTIMMGVVDAAPAVAQSRFPVSVSVGTHALTLPWYLSPVDDRLNPAVMVGTDRSLRTGGRWSLTLGMSVGFFQDHWWMTGVSFEPELRVGRGLPGGMKADLGLGIGYLHYFWRRKTLALQDGRYVESTSWGRPSVIVPLSLTVAYRGDSSRPVSVSPFLSARWAVQGLFLEEIPAATHLFLMGGVRLARGRDAGPAGGGR